MDLSYSPAHESFRREVRAFLAEHREAAPRSGLVLAVGPGSETSLAWQARLIEHGYAARNIPREYGGFGAPPDPLERVIIDEEFNRAGVSRGIAGQGPDMLVPTLLEHGTEEQKRRYVPPTLRGELVWCQGYSEPGAGSDLANVQTRAREDGDHFVLDGQKIWTTTAHLSQMMFALVRSEPGAEKHAGLSYILIEMDTPGIEVRPLATMTGASEFNQVFFSDVRVPQSNVVGRRGEGWKIANTTLGHERNMLASGAQLEAALLGLVALMRQEQVDGRRAIDSPLLRDRLLQLQARVFALQHHSLRLLSARVKGERSGTAGLVTKLFGCELSHQIAALALDSMGELGLLYEGSPYERMGGRWQFLHMFSLGLIIGGGTAQIQKNIISERGLGMPREARPGEATGA